MKLGLLAMSGVRAHNPELTTLGLTLPGFVERNRTIASLPSLGLLTLAGLTTESVDVEFVDVPDVPPDPWLPGEFDVVAISSFSAQVNEAYALADRYRAAGTQVVLGGMHVTAMPDEASRHADAIVIGEGEPMWPQVVSDLQRGALKPRYDARHIAFDLATAPMPRFDLLSVEKYNRITVQTQRGCPYNCEFCAASIRLAPGFKTKPVGKVMTEIQRIKRLWPTPFIEFADDNTFANKAPGRRLLTALAREHVRWFTESDVSIARDSELLSLMRDSGCAQVLIGFEASARGPLERLEQQANWKARQFDRYREAIDVIQSHGITVNGCFILGLAGAGPESFNEVREFVRTSGLYEVQTTVQTAFPGTPLYQRLQHEGRILRQNAWELCTLFDVNFQPARMTVGELELGLRDLAAKLYDADATRERRQGYRRRLVAARRRARHVAVSSPAIATAESAQEELNTRSRPIPLRPVSATVSRLVEPETRQADGGSTGSCA
jgi:radical SAM superfamily enzyme YgiQ (UPF0313 family)